MFPSKVHQINLCWNLVCCIQQLFLNNNLKQTCQILAWINLLILLKIIPLASLDWNMYHHRWLDFRFFLWFHLVLKNITAWEWLISFDQKLFEDDILVIFDRFSSIKSLCITKNLANAKLLVVGKLLADGKLIVVGKLFSVGKYLNI